MRKKIVFSLLIKILGKITLYSLAAIALLFAYLHVYHMGQYSTEVIHHNYDKSGEKAFKECVEQHSPDYQQCMFPTVRTVTLFLSMFK